MPIADLGYKPYEGKRLSTRRNHWVITAMEVRRIWASLLVKILVILAALWGALQVLILLISGYLKAKQAEIMIQAGADTQELARGLASELSPAEVLADINSQLTFVILLSMAWGAGAIANDIRGRSLQFYFAKPVTERSYLLGKIIPLTIYCFVLSVFPAIVDCIVEAVLLRGQGLMASRLALILPSILHAAILSVLISVSSVGISSLAKNRLLTLAYWSSILFVPLAIAFIVDLATHGDFQWLYVASPLSMLNLLGEAVFRIETSGPIEWYHALVVVVGLTVASFWVAWQRLSQTEVIG